MKIQDSPAYRYAAWCRDESDGLVPVYVKKQASDWVRIADGNDPDAVVDEAAHTKICKLL